MNISEKLTGVGSKTFCANGNLDLQLAFADAHQEHGVSDVYDMMYDLLQLD